MEKELEKKTHFMTECQSLVLDLKEKLRESQRLNNELTAKITSANMQLTRAKQLVDSLGDET